MRLVLILSVLVPGLFLAGFAAYPLTGSTGGTANAQSAVKRGPSGLPLPRFVSLKSGRANLRVGPSVDYGVAWLYTRRGLPMEIIQEYDHWRQVRDAQGTEGWIYQSLLSGERTAEAAPWMKGEREADGKTPVYVMMHSDPQKNASVVARLQPGVVLSVSECNGDWCSARVHGVEGWVSQAEIWGAYPGEAFK